jgi:hypothetical protein
MNSTDMKVVYLAPFVALAAAACVRKPDVGVWDVKTGEIFVDALYALKLRDYDEIERLNQGIDVNRIKPSQYTIPYVGDVDWSATWVTSSCTPTLLLDGRAVSATVTADLDSMSAVPSIATSSAGSAPKESPEAHIYPYPPTKAGCNGLSHPHSYQHRRGRKPLCDA